jgi:hypothetical protein
MFHENDLPPVVNERNQPKFISAEIEDCFIAHEINRPERPLQVSRVLP